MGDRRLYDYVIGDDEFVTIWTNPDIPSTHDLLDADGEVKLLCPSDGCEETVNVRIDVEEDVGEFVEYIQQDNSGTIRCPECDEPLYGILGNGDGNG